MENPSTSTLHDLVIASETNQLQNELKSISKEELNRHDSRGLTALHYAVSNNDVECVRLLLEAKVEIKHKVT